MQKEVSPAAIDDRLKELLVARAASALGLPPLEVRDLSRATLITILEEYAEYRKRDERIGELEAKAIRAGIFAREELAELSPAAREEVHTALRLLDELEQEDAPPTPRIAQAPATAWPNEIIHLVSKLVAVIASQEESLSLIRNELDEIRAERSGLPVDAALPPLDLLPAAGAVNDGVALAPTSAAPEEGSIHARETLNSGLAPLGGNRQTVVEIEGIVSYIAALGAHKNIPLGSLHERAQWMADADRRTRTRAFHRTARR